MPTTLLASALFLLLRPQQDLSDLTRLRDIQSHRESSSSVDPKANVDFRAIKPGETFTMADVRGPGVIRRIWLTILPSEPEYSRLMTIRIYWDGEKTPSVEAPLGDFFGVGGGADVAFESMVVRAGADGRARSCLWPMPFRHSARITVSNEGTQATWCFYHQVDWDAERVPEEAPYFHASYHQETSCRPGNYVVADIDGNGQYVGTVLSVRSTSDGWFGEGNDYFTIDGEQSPRLKGTGFEDYFGEAWGLRQINGAYSGCSYFEGGFPGARVTAYRWHVPDPIRFRKHLRVEFQHMGTLPGREGNNQERPDEFSSVAFWYQTGIHQPYPPLPPAAERLPFDYRRFVEAEALAKQVTPSKGEIAAVKANGLHGGAELDWTGASEGATLTLPFSVDHDGDYQLMVLATFREDGGTARFLIDGKPIGDPKSFFSDGFSPSNELTFPIRRLSQGPHTLSLRSVAKDPKSKGGWFGIDGLLAHPLKH